MGYLSRVASFVEYYRSKADGRFCEELSVTVSAGGKLPVWELGSCETECMIGYHSVSVIADVILKGIGVEKDVQGGPVYPFDYSLALEAMVHSAKLKDSAFWISKESNLVTWV